MDEHWFLERVRREFPEIRWSTHRYLTHGWDHAVLILDEMTVFRTPKDKRYAAEMQNEIGLLNHLNGQVDAGIPEYRYISVDRDIAGYKMLSGLELDRSAFEAMTDDDRELLARTLAQFLTVLHSTPEVVTQHLKTRKESQEDVYKELEANAAEYIRPKVSDSEFCIIERYLAELRATLKDKYQQVLTHSDLTSEHILWDKKARRVNIIDFADRSLNDPAIDFAGLVEYGSDLLNRVFSLYGGIKDSGFLHRAELYFKRVPLSIMIDSQQGYPCTFDDGCRMFGDRYARAENYRR